MSLFYIGLQPKTITKDLIRMSINASPRRICFLSCHKDALKREKGNYLGKFSLPFRETIKEIFEYETELNLFHKADLDRYWYSIKPGHEADLKKIEEFTLKYREIVFLRDCLDLSIALSENLSEDNELTKIGKWEDEAKYKGDERATEQLSVVCQEFILNTPYYNSADLVCAIPPSDPKADNLPRKVIRLFKDLKQGDISNNIRWSTAKPTIKDLELENKLNTLDTVELLVNVDIKDKKIILIDDLYQSGTTIQYVAMKLKEAGASLIYGISFVKARNDRDYV